MKKFQVKADSEVAKFFEKAKANKIAFQQYINKDITLEQLKEQGISFAQPVRVP